MQQSSEAYWEPCRTIKIEPFTKIANGFQPLTIFVKGSMLDAWQGSEYVYQDKTSLCYAM